ncbi:hypothetical protein [Piscinibacter terrae]|uniref:Uncharacterized protein n=1 Tax=Piscinibacter terrae TaxID=2496871 RepID=A0A3N7HN00_9BURK|nr:hypothetical protein [Albitalea terrae]RQP22466.1 hypothetical protein DZC73_22755 [Albitalea terrae]
MDSKLSTLFQAVVVAAALTSGAAFAADADPALQTYKSVVLGDSAAKRDVSIFVDEDDAALGPYAHYLIHHGVSRDAAVAAAKRVDRSATRVDEVSSREVSLSPVELYRRAVLKG